MKTSISKSKFNSYFTFQERVDNLMRQIDASESLYINGYEVDKEKFSSLLSCISASIEELYENLCF